MFFVLLRGAGLLVRHPDPPSDVVMTSMLVRLEPMCHKEQVLERNATVEEHKEREEIYNNHHESQSVFVVAATVDMMLPPPAPAAAAGA